jgi:hypothetical protein
MESDTPERPLRTAVAAELARMVAMKNNGKAAYWKLLTPVVVWAEDEASVKLRCNKGCLLTCSNVSQTAQRHFGLFSGKLDCKKRTADTAFGGAHIFMLVMLMSCARSLLCWHHFD